MKKHKHAIKNLRHTLADLNADKRQVKAEIQALKLDEAGQRRPETGPERDRLWQSYTWLKRPLARAAHLAIGFLRGTPYRAMEPKCAQDNLPPLYGILTAILMACGDDEDLKAEWTMARLQKLTEEASQTQEAA